MAYTLGVDFGGGSSKATLLDDCGNEVYSRSCEYRMYYPYPLFAEQDPYEMYDAFVKNIRAILDFTGIKPDEIKAICFDGGTHIAILLDENDQVIRKSIYWSDARSVKESALLKPAEGEYIAERSYNLVSPVWSLPQLMWIRSHEPENYQRIKRICFLKDYIRLRVTGEFATDTIEAMGSMLIDARTNEWDEHLCSLCGLRTEMLPKVVKPLEIVGHVSQECHEETGLSCKSAVICGATDTVMEVFASGAIHCGDATIKLATAGRICPITNKPYVHPLLVTYKHLIDGFWYPGTGTKTCAASLRWYRDTFSPDPQAPDAYKIIDAAAQEVPPGSGNLFYHPFLQGEITPYQDNNLRASFVGISSCHTKGHFDRAVMEGVAYSLRSCLEVLNEIGISPDSTLRLIGGGSKSRLWAQILSDVLQREMVKVNSDDSSIGSAMLAGIAAGFFSSHEDAVKACTRLGTVISPNQENKAVYDQGFEYYKRIHDALAPVYKEINS